MVSHRPEAPTGSTAFSHLGARPPGRTTPERVAHAHSTPRTASATSSGSSWRSSGRPGHDGPAARAAPCAKCTLRFEGEREIAYTTVMTVLDRIAKKDLVNRERDGRAWRYSPPTPARR